MPIRACLDCGSILDVIPICPFGNNLKTNVTAALTSVFLGYDSSSRFAPDSIISEAEESENVVPSSNANSLSAS